jgi:hypothetical protein
MVAARLVSARGALRLALVVLLSGAAALVTPVGPRLLTSPFQVHDVIRFISEWHPPAANYVPFLVVLVMLTLIVVSMARRPGRALVPILLLTLLVAFFAVTYARTVAIAASIAAPVLAGALQDLLRTPIERVKRREVVVSLALPLGALVVAALGAPGLAGNRPVANALDAELSALPRGAIVCNEWEEGGWLILEHPNLKVTQDPRAELYTAAHIEGYEKFILGSPGWQTYVLENKCQYALVGDERPVTSALQLQLGWSVIADRGGVTLLQQPKGR